MFRLSTGALVRSDPDAWAISSATAYVHLRGLADIWGRDHLPLRQTL